MKFTDREAWLTEAANLILDDLMMPIVEAKYDYPRPDFRISVGFPKHSRGGKAIAVCFKKEASTDGVNEIFINPEIDNPVEVMGALVHELVHSIDNCESGHQHFFAHTARAIGLEGKLTSTRPGDSLQATLEEYADLLGEFPHAKMVLDRTHKKDKVRQLKVECHHSSCGFIYRTSAKQLMKVPTVAGGMLCPACGHNSMRPA